MVFWFCSFHLGFIFGILLLPSLCPLHVAGTGVLPLTLESCGFFFDTHGVHVLLICGFLLISTNSGIFISSFATNEVLPGRFPYTMTYQQWRSPPLHPARKEIKAQAIVLK